MEQHGNVSGVGRVRGLSTSEPESKGDKGGQRVEGSKACHPGIGMRRREPKTLVDCLLCRGRGHREAKPGSQSAHEESEGVSTAGTKSRGNGGRSRRG